MLHALQFRVTRVHCVTAGYRVGLWENQAKVAECTPAVLGQDTVTCLVRGEVTNPKWYRGPVYPDLCEQVAPYEPTYETGI